MAYRLINNTTAGTQEYIGVIKSAGGAGAFKTYNIQEGLSGIATTGWLPNELIRGNFSLGAGITADVTGRIIYDCDTAGSGLLVKPLLANRGNSSFYFGTNGSTPAVANGMAIASGESLMIDDYVRQIWVITSAGSTTVACHADYFYSRSQI